MLECDELYEFSLNVYLGSDPSLGGKEYFLFYGLPFLYTVSTQFLESIVVCEVQSICICILIRSLVS
jgi:hypothetical protein